MTNAEFLSEQAYLMMVVPMDGGRPGIERQKYLDVVAGSRPPQAADANTLASLSDVFAGDGLAAD
ncbi:MAG: hypothetical protein HZC24_13575 [Rhodocyclales bacterium]|nr:hypothetical protein [Rhodocyclales bacterium]